MVIKSYLKLLIFVLISLILFTFSTTLAKISTGVVIKVVVSPEIKMNYYFINMSINPAQSFYINVENSGSVGCDVLPRIVFYNSTGDISYTVWGTKRGLWPGSDGDWVFYSALPPGNYSAFIKILYCKEMYVYGPYNFTVKNYNSPIKNTLEIIQNKTYENYLELTLKSNKTLKNVAVIPIKYPTGWVFTSTMINKIEAGKEAKIKLYYEPSIWKETKIKVKAMTVDGKYMTEKEILLTKKEGIIQKILDFLSYLKSLITRG